MSVANAATARSVDGAIGAGLEFLLSRQASEGCWTDWDLPPGRSSYWTTAYVGRRLGVLPGDHRASRRAAAHWLAQREFEGGGWGYNDAVSVDADTTANAILFLAQERVPVAARNYERLLELQQTDGGFSTYAADAGLGSWGESHPDVTPVAAQALLTRDGRDDPDVRRAVDYLVERRTGAGLWNSFWWRSPLYATRASLAFFAAIRAPVDLGPTRRSLERLEGGSAFERALLLDSLRLTGARALAPGLLEALLTEQLPDGSWAGAPVLRITDRDCATPWERDHAGPLYADTERLFTSATVLSALSPGRGIDWA